MLNIKSCFAVILMGAVFAGTSYAKTDSSDIEGFQGSRICLSLRVLALKTQDTTEAGQAIPDEILSMAGMGWLEGYIVDPENQDIILVGRKSEKRPSLYLDDFVVNLRSLRLADSYPYCSLDPLPENNLKSTQFMAEYSFSEDSDVETIKKQLQEAIGPQQTVIGGVPKNSRHAHVMIDADYHMKKVSQGHITLAGIDSMLDMSINQYVAAVDAGVSYNGPGGSRSRFWFQLRKDSDLQFRSTHDCVWLDTCSVALLTERQRHTAEGISYDSGERDPNSEAFAENMSRNFSALTREVPEYADLENLYRLRALLGAMYHRGDFKKANLELGFFLHQYTFQMEKPMPTALAGLANCRIKKMEKKEGNITYTYVFSPLVCGGVNMETPVYDRGFKKDTTGEINKIQLAVVSAKPDQPNALWWYASQTVEKKAQTLQTIPTLSAAPKVGENQLTNQTDTTTEAPKTAPKRKPIFIRHGLMSPSSKY